MILRQGYTPAITLAVAVGYALLVFAFWKVAKRWDQKEFRATFLPWLVFAGLLRFADGPLIVPSPLTATPGIYLLVTALFLLTTTFSLEFAKEVGYVLSIVFGIAIVQVLNFSVWGLVLLSVIPMVASYFLIRQISWMGSPLPWMSHIFEAWISSFGVMAGLFEEHVIAGALMTIHPLVFGVVKTVLIILIFYLIRNERGEEGVFLRTAILTLGLAAGIRNLMEMLSI